MISNDNIAMFHHLSYLFPSGTSASEVSLFYIAFFSLLTQNMPIFEQDVFIAGNAAPLLDTARSKRGVSVVLSSNKWSMQFSRCLLGEHVWANENGISLLLTAHTLCRQLP